MYLDRYNIVVKIDILCKNKFKGNEESTNEYSTLVYYSSNYFMHFSTNLVKKRGAIK